MPENLAGGLNWMREQFHSTAHAIFIHPERPWRAGDRLRQPELAHTLRHIAEGGASAFYSGEFAERLDRFFRETGGILCKDDLACYHPLWQQKRSAGGSVTSRFMCLRRKAPVLPSSMAWSCSRVWGMRGRPLDRCLRCAP